MIDFIELRICFAERALVSTTCLDLCKYARTADSIRIATNDLLVGNNIGSFMPQDLVHPFESIKSHFSGLAFKIYPNGMGDFKTPHVVLKGSPAKLLQGHNVYGPENFNLCVFEFFNILQNVYPSIFDDLDLESSEIRALDLTYSARLKNEFEAQQVIDVLKHVAAHQKKDGKMNYSTSTYFNERSTYCRNKAYLKNPELKKQIAESKKNLKRSQSTKSTEQIKRNLKSMESVEKFSVGLVRFESRYLARKLDKIGFPTNIIEFKNHCLDEYGSYENALRTLWNAQWENIFEKFEGLNVNVNNDEQIVNLIRAKYTTFKDVHKYSQHIDQLIKDGKLNSDKRLIIKTESRPQNRTSNRLIKFYKELKNEGFEYVKRETERTTFYRAIKQLVQAGIPEYQLHNLTKNSQNVIPLIKLINVDFATQKPSDYIEPKSNYELRRVS